MSIPPFERPSIYSPFIRTSFHHAHRSCESLSILCSSKQATVNNLRLVVSRYFADLSLFSFLFSATISLVLSPFSFPFPTTFLHSPSVLHELPTNSSSLSPACVRQFGACACRCAGALKNKITIHRSGMNRSVPVRSGPKNNLVQNIRSVPVQNKLIFTPTKAK